MSDSSSTTATHSAPITPTSSSSSASTTTTSSSCSSTCSKKKQGGLYWNPFSQPSRAVYQLLSENNLVDQYDIHEINLGKLQHKTPEYLKINPQGFVPALVDDGFQLAESNAILQYLVSKHHLEEKWYPTDPRIRARIDEFLYWYPDTVRDTFTGLTRECLIRKNKTGAKQKFDQIPKVMPHVERMLSRGTKYIATNDHPSIADLQLLHELNGPVLTGFGGFNLKAYPNTERWLKEMSGREGSKKALGKFGTISKLAGGFIKFGGVFTGNKLTL